MMPLDAEEMQTQQVSPVSSGPRHCGEQQVPVYSNLPRIVFARPPHALVSSDLSGGPLSLLSPPEVPSSGLQDAPELQPELSPEVPSPQGIFI